MLRSAPLLGAAVFVAAVSAVAPAAGQDLSGSVAVDEFNPDVGAKDGSESEPVRGGVFRLRTPGDPKSLNPMCDNDSPTRQVHQYLRDELAKRDRETFEWLPHLARWWEVRDTIAFRDGPEGGGEEVELQGRIRGETEDAVTFAPGASRVTLVEHDLDRFVLESPGPGEAAGVPFGDPAIAEAFGRPGTAIPKEGTGLPEVTGVLSRPPGGRYTVWIEEASDDEERVVPRDAIAVVLEGEEGAQEPVPALRRQAAFTFHLREGVTWHDGQPFTADDVVFSFDTNMNPAVDSEENRQLFADLESWTKVGPRAVEFVFGRQYFKAFTVLAEAYIYPRHRFEPWKFEGDPDGFGRHFNAHPDHQGPIGVGPYRFVKWERGKVLELVRYEDYWASAPEPGPDGALEPVVPWLHPRTPFLDALQWIIINEKQAALKALLKGEVDGDFDLEPSTWEEAQTNQADFTARFVRARFLQPLYTYIGWNMRRKGVGSERQFFADRRVRTAMTLLIPRERILREIHRGLGEIVTGPFFKYGPFCDRSVTRRQETLRRAQMLLDEAGWIDHDGDGVRDRDGVAFEFEYVIHNMRDYHQKVAEIIKEAVERAGVRMNIRKLDWSVFIETILDQRFDAVRLAWGEPSCIDTDPYQTWHSSQASGRGSNYVSFENDEADRLIELGRREVDLVRRQRLYRRLHRLIHREQPYTFLLNMYTLAFYGRRFRNVKFYIIGEDPFLLTEWYVPRELQGRDVARGG